VTPPAVILMAGLQGSGKTTTVGKLAVFLKAQKKKVLVVPATSIAPRDRAAEDGGGAGRGGIFCFSRG